MRFRGLEKHFPELAAVPALEREQILEQARYDTFVMQRMSGRWVSRAALTVGLGVVLATLFVVAMQFAFDASVALWISPVLGGTGAYYLGLIQRRRYAELLRPSVQRLCGHARADLSPG